MTSLPTPSPRLLKALGSATAPERVSSGEFTRRARAHDASHFLLYPSAVVTPKSADEVAKVLRAAARAGTSLTFRSGGTSLSGQGGTDRLLVDTRHHFLGVEVLDDGARVRVQPGVTVNKLNAHLAPYGRKLGPDPASSTACTIGGVVANNSSGMACGIVENTYRTLDSLVVVLPSGTVLDTGAPDAAEKLRATEPELHEGLLKLRQRVVSNPASVEKIRQQFSMKNTMGYGVNAFVDFDEPIDILTHLLIGSEGTLGFIASATFNTVPLRTFTRTALVVFDNLLQANSALPALVASGAATLELMDATSLRVGQAFDDTPDVIKRLTVDQQAALLVEYQATSADELDSLMPAATAALADLPVEQPVGLETDPVVRQGLWALRNGLYTSVAGARKPGTTALLEDVVVPVASLADACVDLGKLFDQHGYVDSVIFGHAKDGNIHFMITDRFEGDAAMDRYRAFTEDMVASILGYSGSLKAEHGTGRVMAPFVERQWGTELYEVMKEVKRLFDPTGLLNDSIVISDDPELHLKHIKQPVLADTLVDRCVECGYCEPVCPSRDLTLTPRQRIALRREMESAVAAGDLELAHALEEEYTYAGVETCAVDGMCSTACPMKINTALLVKEFRVEQIPAPAAAMWSVASRHWDAVTTVAGAALSAVKAAEPIRPVVIGANKLARKVLSDDVMPLLSAELPGGGVKRARPLPRPATSAQAVYFPACVNRMFGPAGDGDGVQAAFERLCARAGITLLVPPEIESLCCGTVWSSKSVTQGHQRMRAKVLPAVRRATRDGELPLVCDASSCTEGLLHLVQSDPGMSLEVLDAVSFVAQRVLPRLGDYPKLASVTLHETCSATQIGLNPDLETVAAAVADTVHVPVDNGCCAFAGDRGMLHPELTHAATRPEAANVAALDAQAHASCNRTCELGMTRATGKTYRHILELLDEQVAQAPGHP
ncbi:MAG: FAD-binding oxidoreductase [Propionibacteriaceae bacterium]|jgi:D-lactate dehydrogenase|nr:FAD-binding oxidoreductase [Propionibacteriaceae bacterium]